MEEVEIPPKTRRGMKAKYDDEYHRVTSHLSRVQYYKKKRKKALENSEEVRYDEKEALP